MNKYAEIIVDVDNMEFGSKVQLLKEIGNKGEDRYLVAMYRLVNDDYMFLFFRYLTDQCNVKKSEWDNASYDERIIAIDTFYRWLKWRSSLKDANLVL